MPPYPADGKFHYKIGRHRAGRHRWGGPAHRRPSPPLPLPSTGMVAAAAALACGIGAAGMVEASVYGDERPPVVAAAGSVAVTSTVRVMAQSAPPALPAGSAGPVASVAGLSRVQMDNARVIVEVGRAMGLPARAQVIAVACAMQESSLRNLANDTVGESFRYPHEVRG